MQTITSCRNDIKLTATWTQTIVDVYTAGYDKSIINALAIACIAVMTDLRCHNLFYTKFWGFDYYIINLLIHDCVILLVALSLLYILQGILTAKKSITFLLVNW